MVEDEEFFRLNAGFRIISDSSLATLRCRIEEYYRMKEIKKNSGLNKNFKGKAPMDRDYNQINFNEET